MKQQPPPPVLPVMGGGNGTDVRPSLGQAKVPLHNMIVKKKMMVVLGTRIKDPPKNVGMLLRSPPSILEPKALLLDVPMSQVIPVILGGTPPSA